MHPLHINMTAKFIYDINRKILMEFKEFMVASLLHDIGYFWKITGENQSHSELGARFIKEYLPEYLPCAEIIQNHHTPQDEYQEKIQQADMLSSLSKETEDVHQLLSPFSQITFQEESHTPLKYVPVHLLSLQEEHIFPQENLSQKYRELWNHFLTEFQDLPKENFFAFSTSLLYLLQKYTWCVPSPSPDNISLFDHLKITTALASCLWCDPEEFLLIGGDISGVQDFIYTITSKRAAQSLKGRSLFLELLNDCIAHYILFKLELPLTNILYCGGGNFFILAPASRTEEIEEMRIKILERLLSFSTGELYLALDFIQFNKSDIEDPQNLTEKWVDLKEKLHERKKRKYEEILTSDNFLRVFGPFEKGGVEDICEVCKKESKEFIEDEDVKKCLLCNSFERLTKDLVRARYLVETYKEKEQEDSKKGINKLFINFGFTFELVSSLDDIEDINAEKVIVYTIQDTNFLSTIDPVFAQGFRFMPNVIPTEKDENGIKHILSLDALKDESGGLQRLGVLRADVDNLGQILSMGLPEFTLSSLSQVSQLLTLFFQGYLSHYIDSKYKNRMYVVYSGGDDCFIVGPWNEIFTLADELHEKFTEFTCFNEDMTLSAGISLIHHKFPIYKGANLAGGALEKAKDNGKNKITLFDIDFHWEREFQRIKTLKNILINALTEKKVSRALLYRLSETYADFNSFKMELNKGNIATHRIWRLFYIISRFAKKHKEAQKELSEIRDHYYNIIWENINWEEKTIRNKPEIIPVALKWAEFLTRGEKNE